MTVLQRHRRYVDAVGIVLDHLERDLQALPFGSRRYRQLDALRTGLLRELANAEAAAVAS